MKVVIIGAGSNSFGRGQIIDILNSRELHGRGLTLTLVDTRPDALGLMARFAVMVRDAAGSDATIEHTTDRCEALPGADYIVCAVARKRMELWEQDFRVPLSYGFRHCLGENGGPGAVFHALRSLELVIPICRDAERLCPDALFLNFTNPETRVLHAILHLTKVKAAGLCHGVFSVMPFIQKYTGRPAGEFRVTSAGINHFYCLRRVEDKATGEDILPGSSSGPRRTSRPRRSSDGSPKSSACSRSRPTTTSASTYRSAPSFTGAGGPMASRAGACLPARPGRIGRPSRITSAGGTGRTVS